MYTSIYANAYELSTRLAGGTGPGSAPKPLGGRLLTSFLRKQESSGCGLWCRRMALDPCLRRGDGKGGGEGYGSAARALDRRAHYRIVSKLPAALYPPGEIHQTLSGIPSSRMCSFVTQRGFGIASSVTELHCLYIPAFLHIHLRDVLSGASEPHRRDDSRRMRRLPGRREERSRESLEGAPSPA